MAEIPSGPGAYHPVSSAFTQEDPIGLAGGRNLYGYAGGDPVNRRVLLQKLRQISCERSSTKCCAVTQRTPVFNALFFARDSARPKPTPGFWNPPVVK